MSGPTATLLPVAVAPGQRVVGYYAQWAAGRKFFVSNIHADKLTHINYAFGNVSAQGECQLGDPDADVERVYTAADSVSGVGDSADSKALRGNFNQLLQLKQKYPTLQALISVGGWTWSDHFSLAAQTDASRKAFAKSCIDVFLKPYPGLFDGIDIDWEFPVSGGLKPGKPEDKHNFTLLLAELRAQLDALGTADGKHYLLTIAAPPSAGTAQNLERSEIIKSLDWINLMAYDLHGTWETSTNFNSPLYQASKDPGDASSNVDASIQGYLKAGIPAEKLVMGVPFYGHGWKGVPDTDHGLYQSASGAAPGLYEAGAFDYKELKDNYFATYTRSWDTEAQVPWLYNPTTGIFIGYDDPESIAAKAGYAKDQGLGGVMIWELSQDDNGELLSAIQKGFKVGGLPHVAPTQDPKALSLPRPFTQEIHQVSGIKIDGDLADWPAEPTFTLNDKSQIVYSATPNLWTSAKDLSAQAWVGWAPEGLYLAFKVLDDKLVQTASDVSLWHGDYMELQIDTQLEKDYTDSEMSDDDYQIGISPGDFAKVAPALVAWFGPMTASQLKAIQQAQVKTDDGYILEVFIPKDALPTLTLSEGADFGMNINPSDSDATDQEVMLSTSSKRTLSDPRTFGKIVLVK
ncbi:MAG TPA: glycosyl hydrolase family 18 protein [Patescibacteria group bacterium]|nr:glycosyl hydrolase family 18 protein [Patescibacteria group bacterium]